jgi:hypothetical protein
VIDRARQPGGADQTGRRQTGRGPRPIAPELIAAILAAVVVAMLGGGLIVRGTSAVAPSPPPEPTASSDSTAGPTPAVDATAIAACLAINDRLTVSRKALDAALKAATFAPSDVAAILRSLNADVVNAADVAAILERLPASAGVGARLTTFYSDLHQHVSDALSNSVQNAPAYRAAAKTTSAILAEELPALNAALDTLLIGRAAPSSSPSASLPSPPSASASASATPAATASPQVPGSPSVSGGLMNPGFESGVGPPWELSVAGSGAATWTTDQAQHAGGLASARVEISVPGDERAAIAVRQGGLSIQGGSHYSASIAVRAEAVREVRVRIASAAGETYATRVFTVGPAWQVLTIDSTVFATDPDAYLEIDLGRFAATTWLDDASFAQVAATGG